MLPRGVANRRLVWLTGLVLATLPSFSLADDAADQEAKKLEGTWKFVSLKSDGEEAPRDVIASWQYVIRGKDMIWVDPVRGETKTTLTLDPSQSPKAIDITGPDESGKTRTLKGIYQLKDDRLTICFPEGRQKEDGRDRPKTFDGGKGMSLVVLERAERK